MDAFLRTLTVYLIVLLVLRLSGKRTLGQITVFDFVLLLIISEATQHALLGEDQSLTTAAIVIVTLVGADRLLDSLALRSDRVERVLNDLPLILVENGQPHRDRMKSAMVDESDILERARELQGLERMEQVKYAVLERSGGISIIPRRDG